jgi:hypothetical protein
MAFAQTITLYQRVLTALSVGVAAIASAIGNDPTQTIALLVGIGITLFIQLGKELESVSLPAQQWMLLRKLIEQLVHEVNSYVAADYEYSDLDKNTRWIWLVSRCQHYIRETSKEVNGEWAKTFAVGQPNEPEQKKLQELDAIDSLDPSNDPKFKKW